MTTLTASTRPQRDANLRPVPWRRMAWVTWRQHRPALTAAAAFLGALAVYIWIAGRHLHHAYTAAITCHPATSPACGGLVDTFNGTNPLLANGFVLQAVPALIGAFLGAPLLARELETGTFRYAWTQAFGRCRWTIAKLVPLAIAVTGATAALSVLLSWYYQPYLATGDQSLGLNKTSPLTNLFIVHGIAFAAWTLAAFAIGALAGTLIRRVVPALVATLVAYVGLIVTAALYLRPHYLSPLVARNLFTPPTSDWVITHSWTKDGRTVNPSTMNQIINAAYARTAPPLHGGHVKAQKLQAADSVLRYVSQHGYTQWTRYHPGSRYWPFQLIEAGWLLALSTLLIATTIWLVRRRAA